MDENPKLEWMYKGASDLLNREEYLLGRSIDKNFENLDNLEKNEQQEKLFGVQVPKNHVEYECIPFSIREYKNLQTTEQVDMQRKLMEDPLMAIKQKEMETRRKILENPVKLKQIHKLLKAEKDTLVLSNTKKTKKPKKHKKKKKKRKSNSSSVSDDDSNSGDEVNDLDKLLAKKYKKVKHSLNDAIKKDLELGNLLKKSKERKKSRRYSNASDSSEYKNERKKVENMKRREDTKDDTKHKKYKHHNESSSEREIPKNKYATNHLNRNSNWRYKQDQSGRSKASEYRSSPFYNKNSRERKFNDLKNQPKIPIESNKAKLSDQERERRLKEMMEDATKRDEERSQKVKKYRRDYETEEIAQKNRKFDDNFAKNELKKAFSSNNTVESRIKSKINYIQRCSTSMDTNFAKK